MKLSTLCISCLHTGIGIAAISLTPALVAEGPASTPAAPSVFSLNTSVTSPTRNFLYQPVGVSSSSSDDVIAAGDPADGLAVERENLSSDDDQPPPGRRRTYGRSRYQDKMHNADGSTKIAVVAGAGMTVPAGNTGKYYTPSYAIVAGAGFNFNKMFGVLGEFHYDHMNLTPGAIAYQNNVYQTSFGASASDLLGLDGNAHVIALTVNPVVNFVSPLRGGRIGAYATGGVGYYHKATNFTLPTEFDTIYGSYVQNSTFDTYTANSFGVNGGVGLTYKLSEFSSERLFIEARYDWLKIGAKPADAFPFNARNTEYIPITVGVRF